MLALFDSVSPVPCASALDEEKGTDRERTMANSNLMIYCNTNIQDLRKLDLSYWETHDRADLPKTTKLYRGHSWWLNKRTCEVRKRGCLKILRRGELVMFSLSVERRLPAGAKAEMLRNVSFVTS